MSKKKKLHINKTDEIVAAWDSGAPLRALCGYSRSASEEEYDRIRTTAETCDECWLIVKSLLSSGEMDAMLGNRPASGIRQHVAGWASRQWTYNVTFDSASPKTWNSTTFPPAA